MAASEKNVSARFILPTTLWSLGLTTKKLVMSCFLSLSLLSIDVSIADVTLAMLAHLFWRLVSTVYFRRPLYFCNYFRS